MVHGTLLALVALSVLERWIAAPKLGTAALLGLVLGAVFLTKVEFTAALLAALALAFTLCLWRGRISMREIAAASSTTIAGALVAPALAFGALASAMPAPDALRGVLGAWAHSRRRAHRISAALPRRARRPSARLQLAAAVLVVGSASGVRRHRDLRRAPSASAEQEQLS
jgi:hypothetical protein